MKSIHLIVALGVGCSWRITDDEDAKNRLVACKNSLSKYYKDGDGDQIGDMNSPFPVNSSEEETTSNISTLCSETDGIPPAKLDSERNCLCLPYDPGDVPGDCVKSSATQYCNTQVSDCDDGNSNVGGDRNDVCDNEDNDCDGLIDEDGGTELWYPDADGDGRGDMTAAGKDISNCSPPAADEQLVANADDCDDADACSFAGASEAECSGVELTCSDGIDQNCDGEDAVCALFQGVEFTELRFKSFTGASAAAALGDVDDDGLADFALGFPNDSVVRVYYGADLSAPGDISGDSGTNFGASLAVGNLDDDEPIDIVVGAPLGNFVSIRTGDNWSSEIAVKGSDGRTLSGDVVAVVPQASNVDKYVTTSRKVDEDDPSKVTWRVHLLTAENSEIRDGTTLGADYTILEDSGGSAVWPLSLAADENLSMLSVGYSSGNSSIGPGLETYLLSDTASAALTLRDAVTADSALGASVAFATFSDGTSLILIGAPGSGDVYALVGVTNGTYSVDESVTGHLSPSWFSDSLDAGSAIALIGDVNGTVTSPGEPELAIGGNDTLWILAQSDSSFPEGNLDKEDEVPGVAAGTITGFGDYIRHIVNAGDVDGDGYEDLLVSTDDATWLLYGGFAATAGGDSADTGG